MRNFLLILSVFWLWTCSGGDKTTGPEEPVNTAPTAYNFSANTTKNVPTTISLIAADSEGDNLVYSIVETNNANVSVINGANVSYEPNNDFVGTDTFSYQANDGTVNSNVAIVTVTVSGTTNTTNTAPTAYNFSANATKNVPTTIELLGNDSENDNLIYSIVESNSGSITVIGDGPYVTYESAENYYGFDSFQYQVTDGTLNSNTAVVTVNISNQESYIVDVNEYDHDGFADGFSDSKLRASDVSYHRNSSIVQGTQTNEPSSISVNGSTNFLVENRAGIISQQGQVSSIVRDFDRFNLMTSNWSVEINFNESSLAWDYMDGEVNGTVPFSIYFYDNNTGNRYRGWIQFFDENNNREWDLWDGSFGVVSDPSAWPGYEAVFGYLSMNEYNPANDNQYISDNELFNSSGLSFGTCGNIVPYNGDICYPMLTELVISSNQENQSTMLPTAANHSLLGTGYNTGSAIFIRTGINGINREQ